MPQEADADALAAGPVCEDFVFWRRVSDAAPLSQLENPREPEPQQPSRLQPPDLSARDTMRGLVVKWGDRADTTWVGDSDSDESSGEGSSTAGPIMHDELGKYFSRLVAVGANGCRIPIEAQPCRNGGAESGTADGWQQPHTFAYEPNALLRQFYPVIPPGKLHGEASADAGQDEQIRYTTDDTTSTEKRKERGLSTD